jgi:hypothetical protein
MSGDDQTLSPEAINGAWLQSLDARSAKLEERTRAVLALIVVLALVVTYLAGQRTGGAR